MREEVAQDKGGKGGCCGASPSYLRDDAFLLLEKKELDDVCAS